MNLCKICGTVVDLKMSEVKKKQYIVDSIEKLIELSEMPDDNIYYNNTVKFDLDPSKENEKLYSKLKQKSYLNIFYSCKDCSFKQCLKPGQIIYATNNNDEDTYVELFKQNNKLDLIKHFPPCRLTKDYICNNKECPSHTDLKNKEAILYRTGNGFLLMYVCKICDEIWTPTTNIQDYQKQ